MKKKLLTIVAGACLVLALVALSIVSCGEVEPGPTPGPGPEPTPGPGPVTPTPPVGEPQYGGVLRIGLRVDAQGLGNPIEGMNGTNDHFPASPCIEYLFHLSKAGDILPWLAIIWEEDPEAKTITFTLREGVKFHDGTDFNAEAVKYNLDRYAASPHPFLHAAKSIDVVGDYTVRITLFEYDNCVITTLAAFAGPMVSPTAMEAEGPDWCRAHPVGTGPFKFVSWERDVCIKYERFDDYWGGKPYLDGIQLDIIADPLVQSASFQAGEVDVITGVSPKDAKDLEASGKYRFSAWKHSSLTGLWPDGDRPSSPFSDVRVRQALSYAINNQEICDVLGYGYWEALNQPAYKAEWGYNLNVVGYPYDPAKARELLAEAGYPGGFKTELFGQNDLESRAVNTIIQSSLGDIGIDVKVEACDRGRFSAMYFGGWEGLCSGGMGANIADVCYRLKAQFRSDVPLHASTLRTPEIDNLIVQALAAGPDTKKDLAGQAIESIIDGYCVFNPVSGRPFLIVIYPQVQDEGCLDTWWDWTWGKVWLSK